MNLKILSTLSREASHGNSAWAVLTANEYMGVKSYTRMAIVKKAAAGLTRHSASLREALERGMRLTELEPSLQHEVRALASTLSSRLPKDFPDLTRRLEQRKLLRNARSSRTSCGTKMASGF